eukprot:GDKI01002429.1.p1 GENE.GDKI01002429.1~~GDKI01002429.1.p1  ORF type:complete len:362 (-),score=80.05 GDKI01002429.1:470-1555(-)
MGTEAEKARRLWDQLAGGAASETASQWGGAESVFGEYDDSGETVILSTERPIQNDPMFPMLPTVSELHKRMFPSEASEVPPQRSPFLNDPFFVLISLRKAITSQLRSRSFGPRASTMLEETVQLLELLSAVRDRLAHHTSLAGTQKHLNGMTVVKVLQAINQVVCIARQTFLRDRENEEVQIANALWEEFFGLFAFDPRQQSAGAGPSREGDEADPLTAFQAFQKARFRRKTFLDTVGQAGRVDPETHTLLTGLKRALADGTLPDVPDGAELADLMDTLASDNGDASALVLLQTKLAGIRLSASKGGRQSKRSQKSQNPCREKRRRNGFMALQSDSEQEDEKGGKPEGDDTESDEEEESDV